MARTRLAEQHLEVHRVEAPLIIAQAEFLRVGLDPLPDGVAQCFEAELATTCPVVGVYPVDVEHAPCGPEALFPNLDGRLRVVIGLPATACRVAIRNAALTATANDLKLRRARIRALADIAPKGATDPGLARDADAWCLVHSIGKAGTVSLETTLNQQGRLLVDRAHFLGEPQAISELSTRYLLGAAMIRARLRDPSFFAGNRVVFVGLRRPVDTYVAAAFQNYGTRYVEQGLGVEDVLEDLEAAAPAWDEMHAHWWQRDFHNLYGVPERGLRKALRRQGPIREVTNSAGIRLFVYRIEDGSAALAACVAQTGRVATAIPFENAARDKVYDGLYRSVRARIAQEGRSWVRESALERLLYRPTGRGRRAIVASRSA